MDSILHNIPINAVNEIIHNFSNISIETDIESMLKNTPDKKMKDISKIDKYLNAIYKKCENTMPLLSKNAEKVGENIPIPTFSEYDFLTKYKYNNQHLKLIAKKYKIKLSGNKHELIFRLYNYLKLSCEITKIQKCCRGFLQRKYNKYHGPAGYNRMICTNTTDFMTMDELKDIPFIQFFSYKDVDNFIYGFDIISLYNLISKSGKNVKNPYNRNDISLTVIHNLRDLLRIGKILNIKTDVDIKNLIGDITPQKNTELRILELFQRMDSLGNYSNTVWFSSLDKPRLIRFMRELNDIWMFRAQLSIQTKRCICPPYGDPFRNINYGILHNEQNIENIKKSVLCILERFVNSGIDCENQKLGAFYVLGALTLVNSDAASALPWLYDSMNYSIA